MRILAIRGENLASLGAPFALELEREPLRSAGLFAITGETGAGKSTILDALCLALYDKFPRVVAPGGSEGAPDPSGETLGGGDPRAILRRGAGRGSAEADFVARDGQRYRARCDLARARGKAAGALQKRARSLWRIDESGGVVAIVESGVDLVNKRIVELTDLTFDQFRRTALLAQGEFDAFLRADGSERAELLEKITGAQIYGRLSKRAHEAAAEARSSAAALEQRRKDIGLMSQTDRAGLETECVESESRRAERAVERARTIDALRRHDALVRARTKLAQAMAARDETLRALNELAPQREQLADVARAEPAREPRAEMRRAEVAFAESKQEASLARAQVQEAGEALEAAQTRERAALDSLATIERDVEGFMPIWEQARDLDARVTACMREESEESRQAAETANRAKLKRDERIGALARQAQTSRISEEARAALDRLAPARPLFERWGEIDDWLEKRTELSKMLARSAKELGRANAERQRDARTCATMDDVDERDRAAREKILARIAEREAVHRLLNEDEAQKRAEERQSAYDHVLTASKLTRIHAVALASLHKAEKSFEQYALESAMAARRIADLSETRAAQAALFVDASRLGELADIAADPDALRLRAALEDEQPCPVCGAIDHPFTRVKDAARDLIEALRTKRDEARRALTQTEGAIVAAHAEEARARAKQDEAWRRGAEFATEATRAEQEFEALRAKLSVVCGEAISSVDSAATQFERLIERFEVEREESKAQLDAARRVRSELDLLRKECDQKGAALDARRKERDELGAAVAKARSTIARLDAEIAGKTERIESLDRSLVDFLRLCDLTTLDLDRDEASVRARLKDAGERYEAARSRAANIAEECAQFKTRIAALDAEAVIEAKSEGATTSALATRRRELQTLRDERAKLLGGEATIAHSARFEEARRASDKALGIAREAARAASATMAAVAERQNRCEDNLLRTERALTLAVESFALALSDAGFDEATAAALLDIASEELAKMRGMVDAARNDLDAAEAAVAARRADVEETLSTGVPEESRDILVARELELSREIDAFTGRLGELRAMIAQDDRFHLQALNLSGEIDEARAAQELWDEIDAAIGSANGHKFRRFAQGVTLEHLVGLANQRLALLAPRYRLERSGEPGSLGLQIVDRELGDERRSTRSLSGGERFLASLALALALAGLEGRDSFVDTLFIDEGFGALDSATLDVAIDALENLQGQGRKVSVISHVESLQQRIVTKVCVERRGGGKSVVRIVAPGFDGR